MTNLQKKEKKKFCYQNCPRLSLLKDFANSQSSTLNFKSFSRSLEQFFLTVGQNNFGSKIPYLTFSFIAGKCENSTNPSCQDDLIKIEVPMVLYVSRILANLPLKIGQCKVTEGNCVCDQSIEDHGQCKVF